jgi:hypothetical protein
MPKLVWLYLTAVLYYRTSATRVALAEVLQTVSHVRLTENVAERLVRARTPGTRLAHALRLGPRLSDQRRYSASETLCARDREPGVGVF